MCKGLGILRRLRYDLPSNILFSLYNTLILPYISYCNSAWAITLAKHEYLCPWNSMETTKLDKLFIYQKKALRICAGKSFDSHTKPLFHELKTLNIFDINKLQTALFMFRHNRNLLPNHFENLFTKHNQVHSYSTRNANNYVISKIDSDVVRHSITYNGPIIWNSLTPDLINCKSLNSFKHKYKNILISKYK